MSAAEMGPLVWKPRAGQYANNNRSAVPTCFVRKAISVLKPLEGRNVSRRQRSPLIIRGKAAPMAVTINMAD